MSQFPVRETPLAEAVRDMVGGARGLNFSTYLSEQLGFVYFSAPAVANIRTIGSLNLAVAKRLGINYEIEKLGQLYSRKEMVIESPHELGMTVFGKMLEDPSIIKFTFVRDPAARFATIYRNMFSINTKRTEPRQKLFGILGMPLEENLSMLDLAELLCEEKEIKTVLPQLRAQRDLTAFDLVEYDFVGHHESWDVDFPLISAEIFGDNAAQFDPVMRFNRDPEGVLQKTLVGDETRAALATAYREDYDMLEEVAELFPGGFSNECQ